MSGWREMLASDRAVPMPAKPFHAPGQPARIRSLGRRSSVSLEFSIVAVAFLILAFGAMELGYDYFVQAALDSALNVAARGVQVGTLQDEGGGSKFIQKAVCPALGTLLECGNLYVSVTDITRQQQLGGPTDYYNFLNDNLNPTLEMTLSDPVDTGCKFDLMLVQAYYLGPTFLGTLVPGFATTSPLNSNQLVHISYSTAGFVNEDFSGGPECGNS
jgi:Flp pilus assembly protein TadG